MLPKSRAPSHPGEILERMFLKEMNITQTGLAKHIKCKPGKINEIVNGRRGITPEMSLLLADAFGNSPQFWLNLQLNHDLWHASQEHRHLSKLKGISA